MKKLSIDSSTIKNISYDLQKRELDVEFVRGAIYKYFCVDYIDVLGMIFADSSGSYFNSKITKNYKFEKVSE